MQLQRQVLALDINTMQKQAPQGLAFFLKIPLWTVYTDVGI